MAEAATKTEEVAKEEELPLLDLAKTAVVNIEFQNEFCHASGKLNGAVKGVIESTGMLKKAEDLNTAARDVGCTIVHAPILFEVGSPKNPNPTYGILAGCASGNLFQIGTHGAEFYETMKPQDGDLVVERKKGLDAFMNTNLQELLEANDIDNVILTGFLTNCCVESTMRTAYEKGFKVYTVPDCCGSTGEVAQNVTTEGYKFFSKVMPQETMLKVIEKSKPAPPLPQLNLSETALVNIEFQNEFCHEKGALNGGVKAVMEENGMLEKAEQLTDKARGAGCKIIHAPISFAVNSPRNPNPTFGILEGCKNGNLFQEGTFGVKFYETMEPKEGDLIVSGKKGLDAFSGTDLEKLLKDNEIKNVILTGFLTNCCVESTMRTAYEMGYTVFTVPDCCGSTSSEAQKVTTESYAFFSKPYDQATVVKMIEGSK